MYLYHATYAKRLQNIRKQGLKVNQKSNWDGLSKRNVLYFAKDPDVAISYAEAAESVADSVYDSGIVVLVINTALLNIKAFISDTNVSDGNNDTVCYCGNIPVELLGILNLKNKTIMKLADITRLNSNYIIK